EAASTSSSPSSMPPGNIGGSGLVRAGVPPSRARRRSRRAVGDPVTNFILDIASMGRNRLRRLGELEGRGASVAGCSPGLRSALVAQEASPVALSGESTEYRADCFEA